MKYTGIIAIAALVTGSSAVELRQRSSFAPPALGPYASDTDHLSNECYGADDDYCECLSM